MATEESTQSKASQSSSDQSVARCCGASSAIERAFSRGIPRYLDHLAYVYDAVDTSSVGPIRSKRGQR
jgi:hypothetical protein